MNETKHRQPPNCECKIRFDHLDHLDEADQTDQAAGGQISMTIIKFRARTGVSPYIFRLRLGKRVSGSSLDPCP